MKNRMSLEHLLEWASSVCAYIEIYASGSAQVQLGVNFNTRIDGDNLRDALIKARRCVGRWPQCIE